MSKHKNICLLYGAILLASAPPREVAALLKVCTTFRNNAYISHMLLAVVVCMFIAMVRFFLLFIFSHHATSKYHCMYYVNMILEQ